jgi:hypothetical protein
VLSEAPAENATDRPPSCPVTASRAGAAGGPLGVIVPVEAEAVPSPTALTGMIWKT